MRWRRVQGMEHPPQACAACGGNPADYEGRQQDAYWAEGVDIDWGAMLYICSECADVIADLHGRVTREGFDNLQEKYEALLKEHEELKAEHEEQGELVRQVREGAAARKRLKEAASV